MRDLIPLADFTHVQVLPGHGRAADVAFCTMQGGGHFWEEITDSHGQGEPRTFTCRCGAAGVWREHHEGAWHGAH